MEQKENKTPNIPKLREDLEFILVKDSEEKVYTVFDPFNNRYFQFKEYEYVISQLLNGKNMPEEVCRLFEEEFDAILPRETLEVFVSKLGDLGLIEGVDIPDKVDKYKGALFHKFKLFNPDKLFDAIIPYIRPIFNPVAIYIFWGLIIFAGYLLLKHWEEFSNYGMPHFGYAEWFSYVLSAIIIIAIISTHEFAHGLSLKNYGGKVPEIGFMLMIFMPAFYCDVSDAWKLPKKQKIFVTFAGGFYEIVVGAIAVIIWCIAEPHLWLADIAYLVMVGSVFTIGFNFNPLIPLDGYYLLSDFLEMPNLRTESIQFIMRSTLGRKVAGAQKKYSTKEKLIFTFFGIGSMLFMLFMLGLIYTLVAGWLADTMQLTGILIAIGILIFFLYIILKGIIKAVLQVQKAKNQNVN